jgi:hypothetical protein
LLILKPIVACVFSSVSDTFFCRFTNSCRIYSSASFNYSTLLWSLVIFAACVLIISSFLISFRSQKFSFTLKLLISVSEFVYMWFNSSIFRSKIYSFSIDLSAFGLIELTNYRYTSLISSYCISSFTCFASFC